ncbi:MAG: hypothetical protein DME18_15635 [Verrucomicrobia bacterium]|nr:MAG: hypothetical protein DME18_15635 [Verrucomicrobiota bacterium]
MDPTRGNGSLVPTTATVRSITGFLKSRCQGPDQGKTRLPNAQRTDSRPSAAPDKGRVVS